MGGSSLGPAVLASAFGHKAGFPKFYMLDSTAPDQIKSIENAINLTSTLFIVSSKSGSTLEPDVLKDYFFEKAKAKLGADKVGSHFIAITDPGSQLEKTAKVEDFRYIFYGLPSIGGRYSILSDFGMIPAAVIGVDLTKFLERALSMVKSCNAQASVESNPGASLGITLGVMANDGKDKCTFIVSPAIQQMGAWLEQLVAESTGKSGKGIIPIDKEHVGSPLVYGADRIFVYLRLKGQADPFQDNKVTELEEAGFPVIRIELNDIYDLAAEFFRFEFAVAVAGSVMGINPFNQPDVEESKIKTRAITDNYAQTGKLESQPCLTLSENKPELEIYTDKNNWALVNKNYKDPKSLVEVLKAFLHDLNTDDYIAILAFIENNENNEHILQKIRMMLHNRFKIATCLGFGPRYLHSTDQVYKGGPNKGIFIEITADDIVDIIIPGRKYTFEVVKNAQAIGDLQVLCERKRRALRIHIKGSLNEGLASLKEAVEKICR
jgi:transaldolase/glucose-6-phosphate isomerase